MANKLTERLKGLSVFDVEHDAYGDITAIVLKQGEGLSKDSTRRLTFIHCYEHTRVLLDGFQIGDIGE